MSTIGKRVIFAGPADGANQKPLNLEGNADEAIAPGLVVNLTATGMEMSDVAATVFGELLLVADKDQMRSKSVDDAWTISENMVTIQPRSGEFINIQVVTAQNLDIGTALARSGTAGTLTTALTDGTNEIVGYSDEDITTSGTELVRVRIV